ncbi:PREDICTED: uncharacterized protein LOC104782256 [Camelina sativa]|uniref:Uncharacterized protein LOC104782256 n=1 Tax=Camelina sativa TaxID=90675 RepID=A0ABM0YT10_CAMSA|nr:PREDICTED: uncharacterized protein LOC104782256 [Camelina sativa]
MDFRMQLQPPILGYRSRNVDGQFHSCAEIKVYCFGLVMVLFMFGSVVLIEGVYGSQNIWLGPNSSILVEPSSIFVQSIKVKELDYSKPGIQFCGFYGSPPLNRLVNWSESRVLPVLSHDSYKSWPYYFNRGTFVNITYTVKPEGSAVELVVEEGTQGISSSSLNEIAFRRDFAWSWNLIQGSGMIQLEISKSSGYSLAVANLKKSKDVEVELTIDVRAVLYDTKQSLYNCTFSNGECTFKLNAMSLARKSVVVTSTAPSQGVSIDDEWCISISYEHRWIAYVIGTGLVICFMLVATQCCGGERHLTENNDSAKIPLLAHKVDDGLCNEPLTKDDSNLEKSIESDDEEAYNRSAYTVTCNVDMYFKEV